MNSKLRGVILVTAVLLVKGLELRGAENKIPAATNGAAGEKETAYRLKWNLETLVGDYERHGRRGAKWDDSAKSALANFAEYRSSSGSAKSSSDEFQTQKQTSN